MKALRNTFVVSIIAAIALSFIAVAASSTEVYADDYDIWVGGIRVTSENASDITGETIKDGSVSYDIETNTLTLDGATIMASYISEDVDNETKGTDPIDQGTLGVGIYSKAALNINVTGNSQIKYSSNYEGAVVSEGVPVERNVGIYTGGTLQVSGDKKLEVTSSGVCKYVVDHVYQQGDCKARVIKSGKGLTVNDATLDLRLYSAHSEAGSIALETGEDIVLSGTANVKAETDGPNGMGSLDSQANAQSAIICNNNIVMKDSSVIDASIGHSYQECTVVKADKIQASGTAKINVTGMSYKYYNNYSGKLTGIDSDISASDSTEIVLQVRSKNAENIGIKGDVSAVNSAIVRIDGSDGIPTYGMQAASADGLKISGDAQIELYGSTAAVQNVTDYTSLSSIGATVNSNASASESFIWDGSTNFDQYKYVSLPPLYSLWVSGTRVSGGNKSDILGDGKVSYDTESNKLTLDGASIKTAKSGAADDIVAGVYSQVKDLTIVLNNGSKIESSELAGAAIKADGSDSGNLTITGTGSLDISVDSQEKDEDPRGIIANGLMIKDANVKLDMTGLKANSSTNTDHFLAGVYTSGTVNIENAAVEVSLDAAKNTSLAGFYCNSGSFNIMGTSGVKINISSDGSGAAYNLSGITGPKIFGSPQYNRGSANVEITDQANLDIDLTKADSQNSIGTSIGIYGDTTVKGDAKLTVESGKSDHSYGAGLYPRTWTVHGETHEWSAYTLSLHAADNAEVSLKANDYASIGSMEASGNAKVTLDGGTAGTMPYQGVKASDSAVVTATGGDYGISGVLQANGDAVVMAQGGKQAIRGLVSESDPVASGKPFEVEDNDGKVVDLRAHSLGTADVKTASSDKISVWNKEDLLGGDGSEFVFVSIPMHEHVWDSGKITTYPTTKKTGVKTYTCTVCGETKAETVPVISSSKALDEGASITAADEVLTAYQKETDPKGSKYAPVMLKSTKQKKSSVKLAWKKVKGAKKYVVYGSLCGKKNKLKKITTTTKNTLNVKKIAGKKLKKGKYYKFIVVAASSKNLVVSTSKLIHVSTSGSKKAANNKKVTVKAKVTKTGKKLKKYKATSAIKIAKKKSTALKASATKAKRTKVKKHVAIRFESSNTKVAKVTAKGKVTGVSKGTAKVYVFAQNGISKVITVKVK